MKCYFWLNAPAQIVLNVKWTQICSVMLQHSSKWAFVDAAVNTDADADPPGRLCESPVS